MEPLYIEISFQTRLGGGFHIIIELMGVSNARYNGTFKSFKRLNAKRGAHVDMYQLQSTQTGHLNGEHRFFNHKSAWHFVVPYCQSNPCAYGSNMIKLSCRFSLRLLELAAKAYLGHVRVIEALVVARGIHGNPRSAGFLSNRPCRSCWKPAHLHVCRLLPWF